MKTIQSIRRLRNLFAGLTVALAFAAAVPAVMAQEGGEETPQKTVHSKTMMEVFHEGGPVMYPLTLCSIALVWLTVDLWMRTNVKRMAPPDQVAQVQDLFRIGDYVGAYQFCKNNNSYFCDVSRVTLSFAGEGHEALEGALYGELNKVNSVIQTRINYLSVLGVCTPMIGLVGTVVGMMGAFSELGVSGVGDPAALAGHIGEVLVATASGLAVAVPAFMIFYFLRNRLQSSMNGFTDILTALFRKMPYEHLKGAHVGEEEIYAAVPNWMQSVDDEPAAAVAVAE
jgi:biopolymer transport protein ExbB